MKTLTLLLFSLLIANCIFSQQTIDSSFDFQTEPQKKYSLYIPSGYIPGVEHKVMLGMHPFNVGRWNAISWRDTLISFAESNDLILVCPDGGTDGRIDDAIDTAFTSALLDSLLGWFSVDMRKIYVTGFSVGGKATYTYGFSHEYRFGGFMPIGAAISGTSEVNSQLQSMAEGKPVYIIHGSQDSPNSRFFPVRDSMIANGVIVNYNYMAGVIHTIDFPNRNEILTAGFRWIDSVNCSKFDTIPNDTTGTGIFTDIIDQVFFNINSAIPGMLKINWQLDLIENLDVSIVDISGRLIYKASHTSSNDQEIKIPIDLSSGSYIFHVQGRNISGSRLLTIP